MLNRRVTRPFVVLSAAVLLMSPCLAASGRPPTPGELKAAHNRVAAIQNAISNLQVRAERAAEAYNGAMVQFQHAQAEAHVAAVRATATHIAYNAAAAAADVARTHAAESTARAAVAVNAQSMAEQVQAT